MENSNFFDLIFNKYRKSANFFSPSWSKVIQGIMTCLFGIINTSFVVL